MKDREGLKKILDEMRKTYFLGNKGGFFLKSCSRTQEFFLFNGSDKEEQKKMVVSYFAKQNKKLYNNQETVGGEYKSDTFCFTEPRGNFKKNNILAKDGFQTKVVATRDIDFKPLANGDYDGDVKIFSENEKMAVRNGLFFSKESYQGNIKLAFTEKGIVIEGYQVYQVFDIAQKSPYVESKVNRTLKGVKIFAPVRNLYERLKKTKKVTTYVGDLKEPILDFGMFDIIFDNASKKYHRYLEGYIVSSSDLTKQYLLVKTSKELDSNKYSIQEEAGAVKNDQHPVLSHKTAPQFVYSSNPKQYDEIVKFVETEGFVNIISKKTPIKKVCGPIEYVEIKNLSFNYLNPFFTHYQHASTLDIDKKNGIFNVYPYKKLPRVDIQQGKISPETEKNANNFQFKMDKNLSLKLETDANQLKYKDIDQLKELQIVARGTDEEGRAILFDLENYIKVTKPSVYGAYEAPLKMNILPYRIFYVDSKEALNIGVFDCIKTQSGEEIIILDATIYLHKGIASAFRDNTSSQATKRFQFTNAGLYSGIGLSSLPIIGPLASGIGGSATTSRIDIGTFNYTEGSVGSRSVEPLHNTSTSSILFLRFGASKKAIMDNPNFRRQTGIRNKSGVRRDPKM